MRPRRYGTNVFPAFVPLLVWWMVEGGCGGPGGRMVPFDSLAADRDRLMLVRCLPPGTPEEEARRFLRQLGPVDAGSGIARQPATLLGKPVTVEVTFRNGRVTACGFVAAAADSADAFALYDTLQRSYTRELGNFHEDFFDGVQPARSFWSAERFGLWMSCRPADGGFRLEWFFRPRQEEPEDAES